MLSARVNFDANNDLQEDLKTFKSDTFENNKTFVPVGVQNLYHTTNGAFYTIYKQGVF